MTTDSDYLSLVHTRKPCATRADAIPRIYEPSTIADDLAYVREQKALFARLSQQGGPGWVRQLCAVCVDSAAETEAVAEVRAACLVLTTLVTVNAQAIEENMARDFAPGLRLV